MYLDDVKWNQKEIKLKTHSTQMWRGSTDSCPVAGSIKPDPFPLIVTIAPVSLVMYWRFAPPVPITLFLTSKLGGALSNPIKTFS